MGRNFISFVGATPFYLAAKHADLDLMKLLVDYGADPLAATGQGVTPLMAASGLPVLGRRESGSAQRHPRAASGSKPSR